MQAAQELDAALHKHDIEVDVQDSAKLLDEKQQRLVPGFVQVLDTANDNLLVVTYRYTEVEMFNYLVLPT